MKKQKEKGTKHPELQEVIDRLEQYKESLHVSSTVSSTKFDHMQSALHWAKQIVRDCYGAPREENATAWVK